jgi:acetylornithine deacetylase/succinyl-diaminopimelate desuccinylase-like protein
MATRDDAIDRAASRFDDGSFLAALARRVAIPTESQDPRGAPHLVDYLAHEIRPTFEALGGKFQIHDNPIAGGPPIGVGVIDEDPNLPTVLVYGHGDTVRGQEGQWAEGRDPWRLERVGDRIYGRGVADNKGQHSVNLAALQALRETRGRLGFNLRFLLEMAEEVGSTGLREFCEAQRELLSADLLIASDGPRLEAHRPTVFMGARGALNFDLSVDLRAGGHHSGNWGGLLANPAIILMHAISTLVGPTGAIQVPELKPAGISNSVRACLAGLSVDGGPEAPPIDPGWGEPNLTPAEKVFAWNTFEVLALKAGNPDAPVNAIPPTARAHCQIRFTVDRHPDTFLPAIRQHLAAAGFPQVAVTPAEKGYFNATRLDPEHPAAQWAIASVTRTAGQAPAVLPNLGGSLPNDLFAQTLGMPTIWVPHSYAGCSQHAPNEHGLASVFREGLRLMTGLFWDLAAAPPVL